MAQLPPLKNTSSAKATDPAGITPNRIAIYLMAILVFVAMAAWVGFLGWGVFNLFEWIIRLARNGLSFSVSML